MAGFGAKEFSLKESISTAFAGFGSTWFILSKAATSPILTGLTAGKINIAEQLMLMALGKQNHFDYSQAATIMLSRGVDSQLTKATADMKSLAQNAVHSISSIAINGVLNGQFDWEQAGGDKVNLWNLLINQVKLELKFIHLIGGQPIRTFIFTIKKEIHWMKPNQ